MGGTGDLPYLETRYAYLKNLLNGLVGQVLRLRVVDLVCELLEMLRGALLDSHRVAKEFLAAVSLFVLSATGPAPVVVHDLVDSACVLALTHALIVRAARCQRGE